MGKTIRITEAAYDALLQLKRSREDSFSNVILRLTRGPKDPLDSAGGWQDMTDEEAEALAASSRRDWEDIGARRG